ncbi:hypothetical protein [Rosistilla oblonga]|uniref:HEAT repeat protein n=1 Tax=Rosistilla oblonga TaxID=2527990 RepID=A0A518INX9_9BACT|nr:hypothetical protein [Rosistilla oblonga]QDV54797.1 hypothetical protein Mal33_07620 [Rosistilla oblonga]
MMSKWRRNATLSPLASIPLSLLMFLHGATLCVGQQQDLAAFSKIGPEGAGHADAIAAAKRLSQLGPDRLIDVLAAIESATPLGRNWLRVIAADIADNGQVPVQPLAAFIKNTDGSRDARYVAFRLLKDADPDLADSLVDGMLNDPSLQLRYEAVAKVLEAAKAAEGDARVALYQQALESARYPGQLTEIAKSLREAGHPVDLAAHMGFIKQWQLVAPFDNTDGVGFAAVYAPEKEYLESPQHTVSQTSYAGKLDKVSWQSQSTDDELGMLDLNPVFKNEKAAVCYGYFEIESPAEQPAQLRLGSIVANKIWVNGKLATANEVYHARTGVDQYIAEVPLRKGKNTVLVKICQNAQTQSWAQVWEFQLRITDPNGNPLHFER